MTVVRWAYWSVCILGVLLSMSGCGGGDSTTNSENQSAVTIVPGVSIDHADIGQTLAEITEHYGAPDTGTAQQGYVMVTWENLGLSAGGIDGNVNGVFDADELCQGLAVSTPYPGKTSKGIGVGSTRVAVRNAYETPEESTATNDKYLALGIAFIYQDDASDAPVMQIAIFPAGSTVPTTSSTLEGHPCRNNR